MIKLPKTIRTKLFLSFTGAILLLQLFFWAISSYGMQSILIFGRESNMKGLIQRYEEWKDGLSEDELFAKLAYAADGNLTFLDTDNGNYYSTMPTMRNDRMMAVRGRSAFQVVNKNPNIAIGSVKTLLLTDPNGSASQVTVLARLDQSKFLVSERQLSVIKESTGLFSSYLGIASLAIVIVGAFISQWMARRITKPIIEIEEQAVRISNLEFNSHNAIQSEDEIGSLALAVNQISSSLEEKIGQLSEANLKLKGEIEQERQLDMARRSFIANVSHELRTPISMIMGYADGLQHGVARTEDQKHHYYNVIIKESEHMSLLINQLLDLSAYQAGNLPCHLKKLDLNEVLLPAIQRHRHLIEEKGLKLASHLIENAFVSGDQHLLDMVMNNLLSNAYKYADNPSVVDVKAFENAGTLVVEISNSCSDFEIEDLSQLTVSFYRGKNARDKQIEGFGIGLGAVSDLIAKHGGSFEIDYAAPLFKVRVMLPKWREEGLEQNSNMS